MTDKPVKKPTAAKAGSAKAAAGKSAEKGVRKTPAKRSAPKTKKAPAQPENVVRIDGKDYPVKSLSDRARAQILNLQATDQRITHLEQELLITQTARKAYADALASELGASKDDTLQ